MMTLHSAIALESAESSVVQGDFNALTTLTVCLTCGIIGLSGRTAHLFVWGK